MGGFLVNGCGAADNFYPKLALGNHFCKYCHSIQEFDLMEVKRKIKVFYIPTVSINTKYAVTCKKCKRGYYIDDKVRDELLNGRLTIEVDSGNIIYKKVAATSPEIPKRDIKAQSDNESINLKDKSPEDNVSRGVNVVINRCPYCMEDMGKNNVCPRCRKDSASYINNSSELSYNTILQGKYLIGSVLEKDESSITYIGCDLTLNIKVFIKEYFPENYVSRRENSTMVNWRRDADISLISNSISNFLREAVKSAKVNKIPDDLRVRETFTENETAYVVMDFVEGII